MKEFIEKLIGRLEEEKNKAEERYHKYLDDDNYCNLPCVFTIADIVQDKVEVLTEVKEIVNQLAEEYNNGWIPCSERLPEKDMWCLATFESGNVDKIQYLVTNNWGWNGMRGDNKVIAWMPLPQPYKAGD